MRIGGRSLMTIARALLKPEHYSALFAAPFVYEDPARRLWHYLSASGTYPTTIALRTPTGPLKLVLDSHHDLLTVNEIFCRSDYLARHDIKVVVDLGANIGISAAYFLTRNRKSHVYAIEPLSRNVERLDRNLSPFRGRYEVGQYAVGTFNGPVEFAVEPTGRYGGFATVQPHVSRITVECRDVNDVLDEILKQNDRIDILKMDIENIEVEVLHHIRPDVLSRIQTIFVENEALKAPVAGFSMRKHGLVAQMFRI